MPITGSPYSGNVGPDIKRGLEGIAELFAPPSGSEMAGYASAKDSNAAAALKKQKLDQISQLFANPNGPNFDRQNIVVGNYNPTQSFYAQDQNNATTQRGQDITARTDITKSMLTPVAQDATRFVPPSIADLYGTDQRQEGMRTPLSETQVKGGLLQQQLPANPPALTNDQTVALTMGSTPVENIVGPDGKPKTVLRTDAVGEQPAYAPSANQSAYDQTTDKAYADTDIAVQKDAAGAQGTLNTVAAMRTLMADPNFYSGPAADQIQAAKQIGAMLGLSVPDAASPMEAFNGLSNQLIIDAAGGSLGNQISNGDVKFLQGSKPNLGNTAAGNKLLLDITSKLAKRKMEVAGWAEEYKAAHGGQLDGGWTAFEKQKAEAAPIFPPIAETQPGAPATGAAVPAGTTKVVNGVTYTSDGNGGWDY